jgi:hypothetical protein
MSDLLVGSCQGVQDFGTIWNGCAQAKLLGFLQGEAQRLKSAVRDAHAAPCPALGNPGPSLGVDQSAGASGNSSFGQSEARLSCGYK